MKKIGFTLAEVLITLVIIGVIAAMTVPTLMNNTQGQENKTAFKKAISAMNQALTAEHSLEGNTSSSLSLAKIMKKRTNVITTVEAWPGGDLPGSAQSADSQVGIFATADGFIYNIPDGTGNECLGEPAPNQTDFKIYEADNCGVGAVDVNGIKGPNKHVTSSNKPEDQFTFTIFATKVIPGEAPDSVEAAIMYDQKGIIQ